ncbi:MAG: hypothetical protein IT464_06680 [Planctomycetes bacterium]|nr:hypothetical protein [Planctomycetota bacterium]
MTIKVPTRLLKWLLIAAALFCPALAAQTAPPASASKESFVIEPGTLPSGAKNVAIRLIATTASGFSNSSSKLPNVKFSAGATLVPGSFIILNQNEAECRVSIEDSAFGTIEVKVELFGVNGSTVLKTLRGTLGIAGPQPVTGSQAKLSVEEVLLVRVNVQEVQKAGTIVISGRITGTVRITAPTGTTFSEAPVPDGGGADINPPKLETANTVFTFSIGNAAQNDVSVRITGIKYMTALFTPAGGVPGDLACEVTGGALSNQSALVVNAFTAKTTIEGSNDVVEPPANTGSQPSGSTDAPPPAGRIDNSNLPGGTNRNSGDTSRRDRNDRNNQPGNPAAPTARPGQVESKGQSSVPPPAIGRAAEAQPAGGPQGAAPADAPARAVPGASGPGAGVAGTGSIAPGTLPAKTEGTPGSLATQPKDLVVTTGLNFCDKDFKPISAVVLNKIVSGEAGGRVWIVLKLAKDKNADRVDTVTVKLTLAGVSRELQLTETGKNTGEFRCSQEGVLLISEENPDSNEPEAAKVDPKPRFPNR